MKTIVTLLIAMALAAGVSAQGLADKTMTFYA